MDEKPSGKDQGVKAQPTSHKLAEHLQYPIDFGGPIQPILSNPIPTAPYSLLS